MYRYLFTNDLRISSLNESLQKAGHCFVTNTVPSSTEDKSANNNMMTLGFYFNLTENSKCAEFAKNGNIRAVVLNFIKKFQFPNLRTSAAYRECKEDGIILAPMRMIVRVLYTMNLLYGGSVSYLTKEEIKYFIFYNEKVAKKKNPNLTELIEQILEYRKTGMYPSNVDINEENHLWKHEERQLREMIKVLNWSGCVQEDDGKLKIDNDMLSRSNKADIFDIINCCTYWEGEDIASYREYMDIDDGENMEKEVEKLVINTEEVQDLSVDELGKILSDMYNDSNSKTTAIHMFGIKYAPVIKKNGYSAVAIIAASGIGESYHVEVSKGIRIYESILGNEYGIAFYSGEQTKTEEAEDVPIITLPKRAARASKIHPLNCIIYGAPGTGKTYSTAEYAQAIIEGISLSEFKANNTDRKAVMEKYNNLIESKQVIFTTFHQSYGYEEFIQGLRPDTKSDKMSFKTVDGVFKRIADRALRDPDNNYVIIIDEINRANISKVFGELITLIEDDKRWGEVNQTSATLQSGDLFTVPNNLYIVGTMNSADKSISLIDAALRRRFEFIEQKPDSSLVVDPTLKDILEKLNDALASQLDSADLLIGHSYFMGKTAADLPKILNNSIIPLLYEYFYDNKKKVATVLGDAIKSVDYVIEDDKLGRIYIERQK